MSEDEKAGIAKRSTTFLELITGKIGKIAAVVGVIATLIAGLGTIKSSIGQFFGGTAKNASEPGFLRDCLKVRLIYPETVVSISDWNSHAEDKQNLVRLTAQNNCGFSVGAFVSFKVQNSMTKPTIAMEPTFDCNPQESVNPECWPRNKLDKGEVNWSPLRPTLKPLNTTANTSDKVIELSVAWTLYDTDKKSFLDSNRGIVKVRY